MLLLISFLFEFINFSTPGHYPFVLKAGQYTVQCYGGEGGSSYSGSNLKSIGGRGAYVKGTINITGTGRTLYAFVGGKSPSTARGLNVGGYNGGGNSGYDKGGVYSEGNDGSGGGGGASDLRYTDTNPDHRIIVAAGGSGASNDCDGAPGGTINGYIYNGSNTFCYASDLVNQNVGVKSGYGEDGDEANSYPGSGGGAGWRGGKTTGIHGYFESSSWKGVANSGSSYISGYGGCTVNNLTFTNAEMIKGNRAGDGQIIINIDFLCSGNCSSCTSSTKCVKCFSGYFLHLNKCVDSCPPPYYGYSGVCHRCESQCKACTSSTKCTSCNTGYYLHEGKCMKVCPRGYFASKENNKCEKCKEPCNECKTSADTCLSCTENYHLYDNKCWISCPPMTVKSGNLCEPCQPFCATCAESTMKCTSCIENYYLFENKCIPYCPNGKVEYKNQCVDCGSPCKTCDISVGNCTTCIENFYLYENKCYAVCPIGTIVSGRGCEKCEPQCNSCSETTDFCLTCSDGYSFYNNSCYENCNELDDHESNQHFGKDDENKCQKCNDANCINCSSNFSYCSQCSELYHIESGVCIHNPTTIFTDSKVFTFSSRFSDSSVFTDSPIFSASSDFTKSLTFTPIGFTYPPPTDTFTKSSYFSRSSDFSKSAGFSKSSDFSWSSDFSNSACFSKSVGFTMSSYFSKTSDFSRTSDFSQSLAFSKSFEFTMSSVPEILPAFPVCIAHFDEKNITIGDRCYYSVYDEKHVLIILISNLFSDFKNESSGGSVYIINCELEANNANFTNCVSLGGGGGAIYVKNSKNLVNHVRLENLYFLKCKALYGGAIYIYSSDTKNNVTFTNLTFVSNEARNKKFANNKKELFGGGAVFLTSKNCFVTGCKFNSNKGSSGAFKIFNIFDEETTNLHQLDAKENLFAFHGCQFNNDKKTKNAIFLVNVEANSKIELNKCIFNGKLDKGSYYIDGNFEDNQASPEINIQSCDFNYEIEDAVNSRFLIDSTNNQFIEKPTHISKFSIIGLLVMSITVIITAFLIYMKMLNSVRNKEDTDTFIDI